MQKLVRDFCVHCAARIPPIFGEGTCPKCDPIGVMENCCEFLECTCYVPDWAFSKQNRIEFCVKLKDNLCIKEQMTIETCRYNPILGCDCGYHKPDNIIETGREYHPYDNRLED